MTTRSHLATALVAASITTAAVALTGGGRHPAEAGWALPAVRVVNQATEPVPVPGVVRLSSAAPVTLGTAARKTTLLGHGSFRGTDPAPAPQRWNVSQYRTVVVTVECGIDGTPASCGLETWVNGFDADPADPQAISTLSDRPILDRYGGTIRRVFEVPGMWLQMSWPYGISGLGGGAHFTWTVIARAD